MASKNNKRRVTRSAKLVKSIVEQKRKGTVKTARISLPKTSSDWNVRVDKNVRTLNHSQMSQDEPKGIIVYASKRGRQFDVKIQKPCYTRVDISSPTKKYVAKSEDVRIQLRREGVFVEVEGPKGTGGGTPPF